MTYDPKVPAPLKETQQWFGSIISRPVDGNSCINPFAPSGQPIEAEASQYIRPSPTLQPAQRIQIYNQQYWWRLLNALQESFPLVTRLFGCQGFNFIIGIPYLQKFPPCHWTLNVLGDRLPGWVKECYTADDRALIYDAAQIDCIFCQSFTAAQLPPIATPVNGDLGALLELKLHLQPHVQLVSMPYDLFSFRVAFLKEPTEYWVENNFPPLAKERQYHWVVYRNHKNDISWAEISPAEYGLLKLFQKGISIASACDWIEGQEEAVVKDASQNLHRWLQEWVVRQWLTSD